MELTYTPDEIAQHYYACLDSVWVIETSIPKLNSNLDAREQIEVNVHHLEIMKRKTFWTTEDMSPLDDAIAAGKAALVG